ncbi:glycoside hydrolase family 76 protein [Enterococcus villorum]|uniref:Glycoside hydrolase n=2 Tax=Enterococcus villorum TaxID=112904 RepID=A0A511J305_9ENTE|nr:glycoside hydrolase family 76 protein [Enterococcus villorum]EOH89693.1 hypothetical protein UAO_01379 [Enterococcus villorum ATCC 700913]EOW78364.1 hypothetical protein I591_01220 [Enterococcus villorum ATCC 700913]GEL92334.1 glycoside hydrolase [Enterococcus villorum]
MNKFEKLADKAQKSIDYYYTSNDKEQWMNNVYPLKEEEQNASFHYWWMAHLIDVRIDAYLRTKDSHYLALAEKTYQYNKNRNGGTLLHEYYDDMLWNGLAALRLYHLTHEKNYLEDAREVCLDIFDTAWNEQMGGGFAWKRTQLDYKNTPVNAPIIILALRLYQLDKNPRYLEISEKTLKWMKENLVQEDSKFVEDGINRMGDGKIDYQWKFTYNQGVYIGVLIEFYHVTKEQEYLDEALQCAKTSIEVLGKTGVFQDEGDGGDIGLFKGIEYRYLQLLYKETNADFIRTFIQSSCDILAKHAEKGDHLLAYRDWLESEPESVYLSDHLSGVMALESAATV